MKRLRNILQFARRRVTRPLCVIALIVMLVDIIYILALYNYPETKEESECVLEGIVKDKTYDDSENLKSLVVGDFLVSPTKETSFTDIPIGSKVVYRGSITNLEGPMNKGEFDYRKYYISKGINYKLIDSQMVSCILPAFSLKEYCIQFKITLSEKICYYCPLESGTINTLLIGDKTGISEERKEVYKLAGVAHFLVISGIHISAAGTFFYRRLRKLGLGVNSSCSASILFLFLYGMVVGFTISVKRAIIMFVVRLLSNVFKRVYDMLSAASLALIITIIVNPLAVYDSAFIYSYSTVFAIGFYTTYISSKIIGPKEILTRIKNMLRLPVVIGLFMMPVTLNIAHYYSFASIFVNALLMPFSAPILLLSFGAGLFSFVELPRSALVFDFLLSCALKILDRICSFFSQLSVFSCLGRIPIPVLIMYYILLFSYFIYFKDFLTVYFRIVMLSSMILLTQVFEDPIPRLSMLYIGQGECLVLKTSPRHGVIVDCGSSSKSNIAKNIVIPFLCYEGITKIDAVFCTHSDSDHMGEIGELLRECDLYGIKVLNIFFPGIDIDCKDSLFLQTEIIAKELGVKTGYVYKGVNVECVGVVFNVLWPQKGSRKDDSNADSIVMLTKINNKTILLTGDSTIETEDIATECINRIDVLKVSHHGSKNGTSENMLSRLTPKYAIISAGKNNLYRHPSTVVLERLKNVNAEAYCTKNVGEIDVYFTKKGVWINTFLK